jgi:glucose-1-phosphate thymidylyltransferase
MKGVILAEDLGTKLKSLTNSTNKHLLPIEKQPMIFTH